MFELLKQKLILTVKTSEGNLPPTKLKKSKQKTLRTSLFKELVFDDELLTADSGCFVSTQKYFILCFLQL